MTERKIPDLHVEQLALGELPEDRARALRAALEGDPRLAAIERSNQAILAALPPEQVAREVSRRLERAATPRRSALWIVTPTLALAAIVLLWVRWPDDAAAPEEPAVELAEQAIEEEVRIKGLEPRLTVYLLDRGAPRKLAEQDRVAAGDLLQLSYVAAGASHGVILSIDGRGVVTLHHPAPASASTELQQGGEQPLAHSYELDDAPGFERFFLVTTGGAQIDVDAVMAAARALAQSPRARQAPLELGPGVTSTSVLVRK
ncbi:MAG: ActD-like protein [Myxococcales bacterium]|nr:ActD-like protein [Myxococcales bacterium]